MCRFLIIKSKKPINPEAILKPFASSCKESIAPDGERQKDGYGIAWHTGTEWRLNKSLAPIWDEQERFAKIPKTRLLVAHARGAGFGKLGKISYNQPFITDDLCFVFNGTIKGVKLSLPLAGEIGSQKLLSLINLQLKKNTLTDALGKVNNLILEKASKIEGMNIGLITPQEIVVSSQFEGNEEYFTLRYFQNDDLVVISSMQFGNYAWKKIKKGTVLNW